ncbi:hypothetical protein DFH06DRAFT_70196 [Mycena polygramma]|nr:hypothetical protein DFH06DRAFT_70196 [Mycena polygramma]
MCLFSLVIPACASAIGIGSPRTPTPILMTPQVEWMSGCRGKRGSEMRGFCYRTFEYNRRRPRCVNVPHVREIADCGVHEGECSLFSLLCCELGAWPSRIRVQLVAPVGTNSHHNSSPDGEHFDPTIDLENSGQGRRRGGGDE